MWKTQLQKSLGIKVSGKDPIILNEWNGSQGIHSLSRALENPRQYLNSYNFTEQKSLDPVVISEFTNYRTNSMNTVDVNRIPWISR